MVGEALARIHGRPHAGRPLRGAGDTGRCAPIRPAFALRASAWHAARVKDLTALEGYFELHAIVSGLRRLCDVSWRHGSSIRTITGAHPFRVSIFRRPLQDHAQRFSAAALAGHADVAD